MRWYHMMVQPAVFYRWCCRCTRPLLCLFLGCLVVGFWQGLVVAPPDYQQGDAYRIMFVHVPCAALSMGLFVLMAVQGFVYLVWHVQVAHVIRKACVPVGALMATLALATGSIWGKPTWGAWWVWDARLTSELVLLLLYGAILACDRAIAGDQQSARVGAMVACVGLIDIPIIHFSVTWWQTLHQGSTVLTFSRSHIPMSMLQPLLWTFAGFAAYAAAMLCLGSRRDMLKRYAHTRWLKQYHGVMS